MTELERAARALVAALDAVRPHLDSQTVFLQVHGMPYAGPTYEAELAALRAVLQPLEDARLKEAAEVRSEHWPYLESDGALHYNCGGVLRYFTSSGDFDDRKYRCDACRKEWWSEGADS